ncbi:metallophosphoesterase [Soehngenia longivitae]|uniref:Metallophosphoesterase n=1 Tax=Soehngenia longivitae TaxID=2562294 RepID=A0A4Z0D5C3_9FIRM|nr:metallophosphoesterase [Soehngenia longivitae]TFZ39802.1 metallophosphoesterase [Soehngenia longivitae]
MKILFLTDTHLRSSNPKNRKDDFQKTLENKLEEIAQMVDEYEIDFVIHGGDLFDRPDTSVLTVTKYANIIKKIKKPIYIISGNHDIFGLNPATLDRTMLGLLGNLNFLNIIRDDDKIILEKENIRVQVTGKPYTYDIDSNVSNYILESVDSNCNYSINIVHGMLLDKPFIKGIPYTLIDDILETKADITLSGHYHAGFGIIFRNNKYFINPGSLVRITNSLKEIERIPQVAIITLNKDISIELIPLKVAKSGDEVLDRTELEKNIYRNERIMEFKQTIDSALNFEKVDINDILIEVAISENVNDKVKEEALKRIAIAQMKNV